MNSNSGVRVLRVGGNYNSNDNYGAFYFNANNDATNANANIGSRHLVYKYYRYVFIAWVSPQHWLKILPFRTGFSRAGRATGPSRTIPR